MVCIDAINLHKCLNLLEEDINKHSFLDNEMLLKKMSCENIDIYYQYDNQYNFSLKKIYIVDIYIDNKKQNKLKDLVQEYFDEFCNEILN